MQIFSHRGFHGPVPENTLEAFQRAVEVGADGIETDIRLSGDSQPILFHDRLAPGGQPVATLTQLELSRLVGYEVPTLDVVLQRWPEVTWMAEIKVPAAIDVSMEILRHYAPLRRLIVTSFWHTVVNKVREIPGIETGVLVAHRPLDLSLAQLGWEPAYEPIKYIVWKYEMADVELMSLAQAAGLLSFVYDVECDADHEHCLQLPLHGVITDWPDQLLARRRAINEARLPEVPTVHPPVANPAVASG